jgi:hypothetical protein
MAYTNSFVCPQCCTTSCETLPAIFGAAGACPGSFPNVDKEICLNVQIFHNTVNPLTTFIPPSPFGGTFKADCRALIGKRDEPFVIESTSGAHPQAPNFPYMIDPISSVLFIYYNGFLLIEPRIYVPYVTNGSVRSYYWFMQRIGSVVKSVTCSPFKIVSDEFQVTDYIDNGNTVLGKFHLEITMGLCPINPVALPTPLVSHVTTPCKYLGSQIQDPAKCQCGTANLMSCALYGTCRRTGTPLAGEPICLTCPSYQSP